jgi:hypothetical protein
MTQANPVPKRPPAAWATASRPRDGQRGPGAGIDSAVDPAPRGPLTRPAGPIPSDAWPEWQQLPAPVIPGGAPQ